MQTAKYGCIRQHARGSPAAYQMTRMTSSMAKHARHSVRWRSRDTHPCEARLTVRRHTHENRCTHDRQLNDTRWRSQHLVQWYTKQADYPCREITSTSGDARLVMVSHITSRQLKYFPAIQTTRTQLFNQCTCVAAIIQSRDLRSIQSNFIAHTAIELETRLLASLTNCMTQSPLNSSYKLSLIDTLW